MGGGQGCVDPTGMGGGQGCVDSTGMGWEGVRGVSILHFPYVLIFIESCSGYTQAEAVSLTERWKKNTERERETDRQTERRTITSVRSLIVGGN